MMAASSNRPAVGEELEPFVIERIDAWPMKTIAAVLRDPNPIHFDHDAVAAMGMGEKLINQGPLSAAYLIETVRRFTGDPRRILSFQARFRGNVFEGDRVECRGRVAAVDAEAGTATVELEATVGADPVMTGTATISL